MQVHPFKEQRTGIYYEFKIFESEYKKIYTVRSINIGTSTQFSSFWLYTPPQWI